MSNRIKASSLLFIAFLSIIEFFSGSYCVFFMDHVGAASIGSVMFLNLWAIFLSMINWSWGYRKMFSSGIWFLKRDEETRLLPNANQVFCLLYGIHIIFSLLFAYWLISFGYLWGIFFPVFKVSLIIWAYQQIFAKR